MKTIISVPDEMKGFIELANARFAERGSKAFDSLISEFERLACGAAHNNAREIMLSELDEIVQAPHCHSDGWDTNQLLIEVNSNYSFGLSILQTSPSHLLNAVSDAAYIVLGRNKFSYTLHKMPKEWDREVFHPDILPEFHEHRTLAPGQILRLNAGFDIVDWHITEPVILLRFIAAPFEKVQWTYQKDPVRPWFVASVDPGVTQLSALSAYFAASTYSPAAEPIRSLLDHPNHQVRWESAKALWKINPDAGIDALHKLLSDRHPHVRSAAQKTRARLDNVK